VIEFLVKRFLWTLLIFWVVFTITFFLMRAVPGGPFSGEKALDPDIERNFKQRYNMNAELHEQYLTELSRYCRGDFGVSMKIKDFSINEIIAQGFPISGTLGFGALFFALTLGITAGATSAVNRSGFSDVGLMTIATIGIALPEFVVASLVVITFVFLIPVFPAAGWGSLSQLVLPVVCLGLPYAAYIARLTRTGMLDVLSQDYIRTARAKGLLPRTVILRHALKGALLPVVSYIGPATAGILTGSMIEEKIFAIPGLGMHLVESATQRDYSLTMGLTMFYTLLLCAMNFIVDVFYKLLDPRIQLEA